MTYAQIDLLKEQYRTEVKWYSLRWHYIESCILKAYQDSYEQTGDQAEYDFAKSFIDRQFNEAGIIEFIDVNYYSIDQIRMASNLFALYKQEKDKRYKDVLDLIYRQLDSYPRTKSGSFWHKENYPNQVWLDGLFMGQPFYVQYVKEFGETKDYSDTLRQFANARQFIYDDSKKLYAHAYDESREIFWCDPITGQSPHVWGRAVGWLVMALVDVLELLENEPADTEPLKAMLLETINDMLPHQHEGGMWFQVVDHEESAGNYLESSGTLMLAYAILKGVRLGYLPKEYAVHGKKAFDGTVKEYIHEVDGEIRLGGICKSAGLGRNPDTGIVRNGSYAYYITGEQVVENNGHGVAPLLLAYNEIKLLK